MHEKDNNFTDEDVLAVDKQAFDKRAVEIAKVCREDRTTEVDSYIVFRLGIAQEEQYAIAYNYLEKVIQIQPITSIPNMPDYLLGATYYNAEIWPVINIEVLLGITNNTNKEYASLILIRDGTYGYALAVHNIVGHRQLYLKDQEKYIEIKQVNRKFTSGTYEAQIALLNMSELFNFLNVQTLS